MLAVACKPRDERVYRRVHPVHFERGRKIERGWSGSTVCAKSGRKVQMKRYEGKDVHLLTLCFHPWSLNMFNTLVVYREWRGNTRKRQQVGTWRRRRMYRYMAIGDQ